MFVFHFLPCGRIQTSTQPFFRFFCGMAVVSLIDYENLILAFLESPAFPEEPTHLIHALDRTRAPIPELTYRLCLTFIDRCAEEARDIRTATAADEHTIVPLVFRLYGQAVPGAQQIKILKL